MRTLRLLVAVLVGLSVGTPAAAQFKKLKDAVTKKADAAEGEPVRAGPRPGR